MKRVEQSLQLLDLLSNHYELRLDRQEVSRWLVGANMATDDEMLGWLITSGSRVGLRLGILDCGFEDALVFARQSTPITLAPTSGSADEGNWLTILKARRGKLLVHNADLGDKPRWCSISEFLRMAGLREKPRRARWLLAQPMEAISSVRASKAGRSPLKRLLGITRPDRGDILALLVFALVEGILTLAAPLAVEALVNTVAFGRYLQPVVMLSLLLLVFLLFAAGLRILRAVVAEIMQRRLFVRIAEDLGQRLPRVQAEAFDGHYGPELVNRFLDTSNIQKTVSMLLMDGVSLVISAIVGMAVLAFYHPFLLGFDIVLLALMAFTVFVLGRGAIQTSQYESKAKYYVTSWLEELVRNPLAFSMHGGQRYAVDRTDKLTVDYLDYRRKHFSVLMRQIVFALFMQAIASTVLLGLGGWLVISKELTLGQLVAAELIVTVIVGAFAKLGKHMESYYDLMASVDKVGNLLDLPMEHPGGHVQIDAAGPARIELKGVSIGVEGHTIVNEFSGTIAVGGTTLVSGGAGSGKSLLMDVLSSRRKILAGAIEIDGHDITQLDHETLRQQIGFARDVEIFHGTLAENVHLYRPQIRSNDVRDALQFVGLLDEVRHLPEGADTVLDSDAKPLSRTQALRLMIARAIVGRPRILMIDGTLDGLPDGVSFELMERLTEQPQPWSLILASGRQVIRSQAAEIWDLGNHKLSGV